MKKYRYLVFAGTFDRLHLGHCKLLDLAFSFSQKVAIGITTKKLYQDKSLSQIIESFTEREKSVKEYLNKRKWLSRAFFFPLSDIYGLAIKDKELEAILVSKSTYPNAAQINKIRKAKNLVPLKIIIAPHVLSDDGKIITSERIRHGEIDRDGYSYSKTFSGKRKLILPRHLRPFLRKPIGQVVYGMEDRLKETATKTLQLINRSKRTMVISVGDVVTTSLLKVGFESDVKIIDFRARRKKIEESELPINLKTDSLYLSDRTRKVNLAENQKGRIVSNTVSVLKRVLKKFFKTKQKQSIIIKGEEDLVALPAILLAPLESIVLYGQMDLGVVLVEVTERKKKEVKEILNNFTPVYTS
jgi:phosphopantetheine adenylyltransferase/uncharacterized protein (UPF0218 family)